MHTQKSESKYKFIGYLQRFTHLFETMCFSENHGLSCYSILDLNFALPFITHVNSTSISLSAKLGALNISYEVVINIKLN